MTGMKNQRMNIPETPHRKSHCEGDPKYFFGDEVSNNEDTVGSYFASTLTNDNMENFKTQRHNEIEPKKEGCNGELSILQQDKKDGKVCRPFLSKLGLELKINSLQRIWNVNVKSCRLKKERRKPITHGA
jgi:hypothetical protein